jgi:receptor protein-tyrosine kinase
MADQAGDKQVGNHRERERVTAIALTGQSITSEFPEYNHDKIVEVDQEVLRDAGLIAPEYHEKMLADQFREIKRPLIASAYGKRVAQVEDGNLIMISSAMPGEGKTFTSLNLALSIAQEQDLTVLLVDADVAKPQISEIFGISEVPGLLDILEGQPRALEALIVRTNIEGLSILPAGAPRTNATELLSGSRMDNVVQQLATRFPQRVIVFDTPPLLQTSEAKVLANLAGQVILVVKAESTPQGAVAEALHILGDEKAVSLVLNQSRTAGEKDRYKYGYGYGFD